MPPNMEIYAGADIINLMIISPTDEIFGEVNHSPADTFQVA